MRFIFLALLLILAGCRTYQDTDALRVETQNRVRVGLENYTQKNGPDPDLYFAVAAHSLREIGNGTNLAPVEVTAKVMAECRANAHASGQSEALFRAVMQAYQRRYSADVAKNQKLIRSVADGIDDGRKFR